MISGLVITSLLDVRESCDILNRFMQRHIFIIIFFLFLTLPASAGFFGTTWNELISPVTTDSKYYLMGGTALTGILVIDGIEDSLGHDVKDETTEI